jgi:hypothetical protein
MPNRKYTPTVGKRFSNRKSKALKQGIPFTITQDQYALFLHEPCKLCGDKNDIGICRINSKLGFHTDNIFTLCKICRSIKTGMSVNEFMLWFRRAAIYMVTNYYSLEDYEQLKTERELIHPTPVFTKKVNSR